LTQREGNGDQLALMVWTWLYSSIRDES